MELGKFAADAGGAIAGVVVQRGVKRLVGVRTIGPVKLKTIVNVGGGLAVSGLGLAMAPEGLQEPLGLCGVMMMVSEIVEEVLGGAAAAYRVPVYRAAPSPQVMPTGIPGQMEVTA